MIRSFGNKNTEKLFQREFVKAFSHDVQEQVLKRLRYLDAASRLDDLRVPPSNRLHLLAGNLKGWHSISVNAQWRIIFQWKNGAAEKVEMTDYH